MTDKKEEKQEKDRSNWSDQQWNDYLKARNKEPLEIKKPAQMKGCDSNGYWPCTPTFLCCGAKHIRENLGGFSLHCPDCDQEIISLDFYKDKETSIYYRAGCYRREGIYHPQTVGYDGEMKCCRCMLDESRTGMGYKTDLNAHREWGRRFHTSEYWGPNQRWTVWPLGQLDVNWYGRWGEKKVSIAFGHHPGIKPTRLTWYIEANFDCAELLHSPDGPA